MIDDPSTQTESTSGQPSAANPPVRQMVQTPADIRRRSNLFRQSLRYIVLNFKIFRLTRQHH